MLAIEQDYAEYLDKWHSHAEEPFPASDYLLDTQTALHRLDDSRNVVFVSNVLNASPGKVVAAIEHLVQYKCSTLPQMAGGPIKHPLPLFNPQVVTGMLIW